MCMLSQKTNKLVELKLDNSRNTESQNLFIVNNRNNRNIFIIFLFLPQQISTLLVCKQCKTYHLCKYVFLNQPGKLLLDGLWRCLCLSVLVLPVEGLYCKRPIQSLASSKILTPHPLTARRVCPPLPLVRGEDTLAGWKGGGGSIDNALCSKYVSTLWYASLKFQISPVDGRAGVVGEPLRVLPDLPWPRCRPRQRLAIPLHCLWEWG